MSRDVASIAEENKQLRLKLHVVKQLLNSVEQSEMRVHCWRVGVRSKEKSKEKDKGMSDKQKLK